MDHQFTISETPEGFVAASTSSPYFCFIAGTEEAVKARVAKALAFYRQAHSTHLVAKSPPKVEITRLVPSSRMATRELAVA